MYNNTKELTQDDERHAIEPGANVREHPQQQAELKHREMQVKNGTTAYHDKRPQQKIWNKISSSINLLRYMHFASTHPFTPLPPHLPSKIVSLSNTWAVCLPLSTKHQ